MTAIKNFKIRKYRSHCRSERTPVGIQHVVTPSIQSVARRNDGAVAVLDGIFKGGAIGALVQPIIFGPLAVMHHFYVLEIFVFVLCPLISLTCFAMHKVLDA